MSYIMQIIETEKQPVMSVRVTTSLKDMPGIVGPNFGKVVDYIVKNGAEPLGPAFIAYFNMDMDNLIIEIGFPVTQELEGNAEIALRYIPAGRKAIGFHKGAYSELGTLYERLTRFISEKGHQPSGIVYEYYYNSPEEVPESELLTKAEFILA